MQSPGIREATQVCFNSCFATTPFFMSLHEPLNPKKPKQRSSSSTSRQDFATKTVLSFFPNSQFTNHESLPSHLALSNHVCLDYIGIGLFSHYQLQYQYPSVSDAASPSSSSSHSSGYVPLFSVSYKSIKLKTQLPWKTKKMMKWLLQVLCQVQSLYPTLSLQFLINWLVNALMKLQHPCTEETTPLVQIYGPKIKFDRAPALAFNIFDWKGDKVDPVLVQKLADRNNISLSYGFLHQIWFSDKYEVEKERVIERREKIDGIKRKDKISIGITVVTAALGFLANFEDVYRVWAFFAQFLNADFVEKERWRYTALNQKTIEI